MGQRERTYHKVSDHKDTKWDFKLRDAVTKAGLFVEENGRAGFLAMSEDADVPLPLHVPSKRVMKSVVGKLNEQLSLQM